MKSNLGLLVTGALGVLLIVGGVIWMVLGRAGATVLTATTAPIAQVVPTVRATPIPMPTATPVPVTCPAADAKAYGTRIGSQITTFIRQTELTAQTPRIGMAVPLQRLLDLQTETETIQPPPCLAAHLRYTIQMMAMYREGYQNFSAQGEEARTGALLNFAKQKADRVQIGIPLMQSGVLPAITINKQSQRIYDALEAQGYVMRIDDIYDGSPALIGTLRGVETNITLNETGALVRVTVIGDDIPTIQAAVREVLPDWGGSSPWVAEHARDHTMLGVSSHMVEIQPSMLTPNGIWITINI